MFIYRTFIIFVNFGKNNCKMDNLFEWKDLIPGIISLTITSLVALYVGIFVERFKNRLRTIAYSISSQYLKPQLSSNLGGKLKITINDREINHLKLTTVELENKNNVDLDNVIVGFYLQSGTFQGGEGYCLSNRTPVFWSLNHSDYYQEVLDEYNNSPIDNVTNQKAITIELQDKIDYVNKNQYFLIPVFNRKEVVVFSFLHESLSGNSPSELGISINHKSVKLVQGIDQQIALKKKTNISVIIGMILTVFSIIILSLIYPENKYLIIFTSLFALLSSLIGILIILFFEKIVSFFK